jgi:hypothetical protein
MKAVGSAYGCAAHLATTHARSAAVVMLLLPLAVSPTHAQTARPTPPPAARGSGGGTMPTSASAMVTFRTRSIGDVQELELLILWRGTPGWWTTGSAGGSGSSGGGSGGAWSHRFSQGGRTFEISGNSNVHTADILGKTFDLTKGNAILIDGVDSSEGPRVVGTVAVDPRLPNGGDPNQILMLLGRVKELREHLRCEAPLADPALQARLVSMCALVLKQ